MIKVLSKQDLIQMKKDSGREQDLFDVEALEKLWKPCKNSQTNTLSDVKI